MSDANVTDEQMARLTAETIRLRQYLEKQSETVQVDFRRRHDRATAIAQHCRSIWQSLRDGVEQQKRTEASKQSLMFGGMMVVGAIVHWLLSPGRGFDLNLGSGLLGAGAALYWQSRWSSFMLGKEIAALKRREAHYLVEWAATGADDDDFLAHRDYFRDQTHLNVLDPNSDTQQAPRAELRKRGDMLRQQLKAAVFYRASGTVPAYSLMSSEESLPRAEW